MQDLLLYTAEQYGTYQKQEAGERKENGVSAIAQIDLFTRLETLQKQKSLVCFFVFWSSFHFSQTPMHLRQVSLQNLNLKPMSLLDLDLSLGDDAVDVGNSLVEDLLESLGVLELLSLIHI